MDEQDKQAYWEKYKEAKKKGVPFFPDIVFKDAVVALLVFLALVALAYFRGAPLEARANPADTAYTPRPEWYFLWIFQVLKYFPGDLEILGVVVLPAIGFIMLLLLPFLDQKRERHFLNRPAVIGVTGLVVVTVVGLSFQAVQEPLPPGGEAAEEQGPAALYLDNCASCHGPSIGVSPETDLHAVIAQGKEHEGMPAWGADLSTDQIDALVGFILSPSGFTVWEGRCATCHEELVSAAGQPLELKKALEQGQSYPPHSGVNVPEWDEALSQAERTALLNFLAAPDGERLFEINCASCHGSTIAFEGNEERLRHIISQGGMHLEMPPWREGLGQENLDTLARYVVEPSVVPEGEELFDQNCSSCHGQRVPATPNVDEARELIAEGGSHETMPVWGDVLTSQQLDALVSHTMQLAQGRPAERGSELFSQYCASCHGDFGEGGPNPARPGYVIPPISTREYLTRRDDGTLRSIIAQGQPTFGMSPFGDAYGGPLDDEQIDTIITFMRQWEENPPVEAPPEIPTGVAALTGKEVYNNVCAQCHGPNGEGDIGPSLQDPDLQERLSDQEMFDIVSTGHEATPMIAFSGILTSPQIEDLVDYVRTLKVERPEETPETEGSPTPTVAAPSFSADVMPIFEDECAACHSGGTILGGWSIDSYDEVINSGDHAPAVVLDDLESSILVRKLRGTQSVGTIMPPSGKMSDDDIQIILDWLEAGAPNN